MNPAWIDSQHECLQPQSPENASPPAARREQNSISDGKEYTISVMVEESNGCCDGRAQIGSCYSITEDRKDMERRKGIMEDCDDQPARNIISDGGEEASYKPKLCTLQNLRPCRRWQTYPGQCTHPDNDDARA